jgi:hypothetical protein
MTTLTEREAQLREIYSLFSRRDMDTLDPLIRGVSEMEWHGAPNDPDTSGVARGPDAVIRQWLDMFDAFDVLEITFRRAEEVGEELLVTVTEHARGRQSGAATDKVEFHLWAFRPDGMPWRLREFDTREEALAAADA